MLERTTVITVDSFSAIKGALRSTSHVHEMVAEGDRDIYSVLDPISERAFNYRDTIDVENHTAGIAVTEKRVEKGRDPLLYLASSYGLGPLLLRNAGYNVVSLDKDLPALRFARHYADGQVNANESLLPFTDNSFQAVVSRDFLAQDYHLLSQKNRTVIIDEIHRVLKKGGQAIFYTLYCAETERSLGTKITQGLPDIPLLLGKFETVETIKVYYKDKRKKNTLVLVATK